MREGGGRAEAESSNGRAGRSRGRLHLPSARRILPRMSRWPLALVAALLGAVVALTSCGGASSQAPQRREGNAGKFVVSWTPVPDPIPLDALFGLDLTVSPSSATTEVTVNAGMPGHGHGMTTRPRTTRRDDGTYEARGLFFHMPGEWEITVKVRDGDTTETARFPVTVP